MGKRTKQIVVILCVLALVLPAGIIGLGQVFSSDEQQIVSDSAQDTRKLVDPATQPKPTHTLKPEIANYTLIAQQSEDGVIESAHYFLDSYAYMLSTGDTEPWNLIVSEYCAECMAFAKNAVSLKENGGWISGGEILLESHEVKLSDSGADNLTAVLTANFTEAQATLVDDPRRESITRPMGTGKLEISFVYEDGWKVSAMRVLK